MAAGMAYLPPSPRWLLLRLNTRLRQADMSEGTSTGTDAGEGMGSSRSTGTGMDTGRGECESLKEEVVQALMRLRGGKTREEETQVRCEVEEMVKAMEEGDMRKGGGRGGKDEEWKELVTGVNGRALVVACGLVLFQQVSVRHPCNDCTLMCSAV